MSESVAAQMHDILEEVSEDVKGVYETQSLEVANECVSKLRATSPKRSGKYARGWKVSRRGDDYVVHNATRYRLTHLLEKGHVIANAKGEYGRAPAQEHIKPVEEWAISELPNRIMRKIK